MFDHTKARALGYLTTCTAPLLEPVTVHGYYRCADGHAHFVSLHNTLPKVSPYGYDWAFLAAIDAADDVAIATGDSGTATYEATYNRVLTAHGYGGVIKLNERA